jgi:hypothetical protein
VTVTERGNDRARVKAPHYNETCEIRTPFGTSQKCPSFRGVLMKRTKKGKVVFLFRIINECKIKQWKDSLKEESGKKKSQTVCLGCKPHHHTATLASFMAARRLAVPLML